MSATHNFISKGEVKKLCLKLEKDSDCMKPINFKAFPTVGVVKQVLVKFGSWKRRVDFVITQMVDFDMTLGMEFLLAYHVILVPVYSCLMIIGEGSCFVSVQIN